jgi:hypothetical protein
LASSARRFDAIRSLSFSLTAKKQPAILLNTGGCCFIIPTWLVGAFLEHLFFGIDC